MAIGLNHFLIFAFVFLLLTQYAKAQQLGPDQNDNAEPQGMDWEAMIATVQKQPVMLTLKLTKMVGGCTFRPDTTAAEGDIVEIQPNDSKIDQYQTGQTIHVWMVGYSGNLIHPHC